MPKYAVLISNCVFLYVYSELIFFLKMMLMKFKDTHTQTHMYLDTDRKNNHEMIK